MIRRCKNWSKRPAARLETDTSEVSDAGQNPFPESTACQPVYHATQAKFDPNDMKAGDIGIHFGDMWQAADRGGLAFERRVLEPLSPSEQLVVRA